MHSEMAAAKKINVALVGYQFMGKAHSNAYRQVAKYFPEIGVEPVLKVLAGRTEEKVKAAAEKFGFEGYETDVIDVVTPGETHVPISIGAAKAGKMVFCEKPLANTVAQAEQMVAAVREAKAPNAVCFNYRGIPALALAKRMIEDGRIGKVYHWRSVYLQDWIVDPNMPIVWRLQGDVAGSGSLGDLAAHSIDLARWLVGEITEVNGMLDTFVKQRPLLAESDDRLGGKASDQLGEVTVDDSAIFTARFAGGAVGTFEATRMAAGRKNHHRIEINGSKGSIVFNMERMNELEYYNAEDPADARGFRVIQATDSEHPYTGAYWPVGHIIGYEHTFINLIRDMLAAFHEGRPFSPSFEDGLACQRVLEAVSRSSGSRKWENI
jgi:predicted dehydrogenase